MKKWIDWMAGAFALAIVILIAGGCRSLPARYSAPLAPIDKLGRADPYAAALASAPWPPPGVSFYRLVQQPDGRWRYEYHRPDGSVTWYPGHVRFRPQPGDPRVPWRQRETLEVE